MHVSMLIIAPGPPSNALKDADRRLGVLWNRQWGDYYSVGPGHIHSRRIEHADPADEGNIGGVEWCDRISLPLPESLLAAAYVSPAAKVFWSPLEREESPAWPAWVRRMNNLVRRGARDGSCVVMADFHC